MKTFFILILSVLSIKSFAQDINGKVIDGTGKPLEFVSVTLKRDSLYIGTQITDKAGKFTFKAVHSNAKYHINCSLIGYGTVDTGFVGRDNIDLTTILYPEKKQLNSVTISGQKNFIERQVDRLVFNVENNINTAGLDGLDLLSKTPLVRVDGNSITLVGKEGVDVMVDNRPTHLSGQALASLLKAIRAENISKIEVITNPPAQYDAQGNSGLINIVTKKIRTLGYTGTLSLNFAKTSYTTLANSLDLNYNLKKLLLLGSLSTSHGANGPTYGQERFYNTQSWYQNSQSKEQSNYWYGTLGFEYLASKNTTLGGSFTTFTSYPNLSGTTPTMVYNRQTLKLDSILNVSYVDNKTIVSTTGNFHFNQKIDSLGKELVFDADYFNNTSNFANNSTNSNTFADGGPTHNPVSNIQSVTELDSKGYTLNAVFNFPSKTTSFSFGAKTSFITSVSDVSFYRKINNLSVLDTTNSNRFQYDENTQALFGSVNSHFGKWKLQLGLRAEASETKGVSVTLVQTNQNSYVSLFPTFYVTYAINKKDVFAFNYGRRINRPNFSSFNPFRIYQNQYNYSIGNPGLKPSYSNNFEISNTYNNILSTSFSYSFSDNAPSTVSLIQNGSSVEEIIRGNFLSTKSYLLDNSISFVIFNRLQSSDEFSLYYNESNSTSTNTQSYNSGVGAGFRSSNSIYLNKAKTFRGGIDFSYQFPYTSGLNNINSYYYLDLSAGYVLLNKKLQLSASARDIFKTKNVESSTTVNNIEIVSLANNDSRRFIFSARYSFGNSKLRRGQSHVVSGTEQSRAGN